MADSRPEKSHGMKFAEQQLLRHGWTKGKGLGRDEDGISEAIKVKVKCNKEGIGHKKGEEFTFHWWDHVFNKASSSLQVESDQNGVEVKMSVDTEGNISNKKPRKAALCKDKMYGCFVKAGTLLSGEEQPEVKSCDPSSSSSSEDDERMDLSSTTRLSDADLMKACGGRTAHKGARHGFKMSAKLARLEQQEAEFMAKYGKKNQLSNNQQKNSPPADQSEARSQEEMSVVPKKNKKNKKKKADLEEKDSPLQEERKKRVEEEIGVMEVAVTTAECDSECESFKTTGEKKKRNSCRKEKEAKEECSPKPKKKKKKKKRGKEEGEESNMDEGERTVEEDQTQDDDQVAAPPKKRKDKKRIVEQDTTQEEAQAAAPPKKRKDKKRIVEQDTTQEEAQAAAPPMKRKEKKRIVEEVQTQEEEKAAAPLKRKRRKESRE